MRPNTIQRLIVACILTGAVAEASAGSYSFTGLFTQDDQWQFFSFQADGVSTVTLETVSYNGGTLSDNTVVAGGGFDTLFTLLQPGTGLVLSMFPSGTEVFDKPLVTATGWDDKGLVGVTYIADAFFQGILDAGTYWLALTQSMNIVDGINGNYYNSASGFAQDGNYTSDPITGYGCTPGTAFCDFNSGTNRLGDWAVNIQGVASAQTEGSFNTDPPPIPEKPNTNAIPEPSSLALFGIGWAAMFRKRGRLANRR